MNRYVADFLTDRRARGCTPSTLAYHDHALRRFCRWLDDHGHDACSPRTWTPSLLRQYIASLYTATTPRGTPLSPRSVTAYAASLLAFCRFLRDEGHIDADITRGVRKPRPPQEQKTAFTTRELAALLDAARLSTYAHRDTAILCLLLDCGLRAGEVGTLTHADVSLDDRLLVVRQGKGRKDRVVPFSEDTAEAIRRYLETRPVLGASLFESERGGPLGSSAVRQLVKRLAANAGVEDAHPHRFRHTFALSFLRNGGDAFTLRRLLGHTSLTVTQGYVNMLTDDLQRVHEQASPLKHLRRTAHEHAERPFG